MREYDIYLPAARNDGTTVPHAEIEKLKATLTDAFGGLTHLDQKCDGIWRVGGATFREKVTIVRALDDGTSGFDMGAFKRQLAETFQQESVLIVAREVQII